MPLVKPTLEAQLKLAFLDGLKVLANDPKTLAKLTESADKFARTASTAIDAYIKSATITVPPGQLIVGAGGGAAPVTGSVTSPAIATIA